MPQKPARKKLVLRKVRKVIEKNSKKSNKGRVLERQQPANLEDGRAYEAERGYRSQSYEREPGYYIAGGRSYDREVGYQQSGRGYDGYQQGGVVRRSNYQEAEPRVAQAPNFAPPDFANQPFNIPSGFRSDFNEPSFATFSPPFGTQFVDFLRNVGSQGDFGSAPSLSRSSSVEEDPYAQYETSRKSGGNYGNFGNTFESRSLPSTSSEEGGDFFNENLYEPVKTKAESEAPPPLYREQFGDYKRERPSAQNGFYANDYVQDYSYEPVTTTTTTTKRPRLVYTTTPSTTQVTTTTTPAPYTYYQPPSTTTSSFPEGKFEYKPFNGRPAKPENSKPYEFINFRNPIGVNEKPNYFHQKTTPPTQAPPPPPESTKILTIPNAEISEKVITESPVYYKPLDPDDPRNTPGPVYYKPLDVVTTPSPTSSTTLIVINDEVGSAPKAPPPGTPTSAKYISKKQPHPLSNRRPPPPPGKKSRPPKKYFKSKRKNKKPVPVPVPVKATPSKLPPPPPIPSKLQKRVRKRYQHPAKKLVQAVTSVFDKQARLLSQEARTGGSFAQSTAVLVPYVMSLL